MIPIEIIFTIHPDNVGSCLQEEKNIVNSVELMIQLANGNFIRNKESMGERKQKTTKQSSMYTQWSMCVVFLKVYRTYHVQPSTTLYD